MVEEGMVYVHTLEISHKAECQVATMNGSDTKRIFYRTMSEHVFSKSLRKETN
jgi:hypothetical protein